MNIKTQMGWASFLVALSAFNLPVDAAIAPQTSPTTQTQASIENRLTRISATLKAKESQFPEKTSKTPGNGNRGGGWPNGWSDRGSFFNRR
jgi:rSAM-associated Gly-rich repeat protein